jgi:transcriptional regulator GlxA family with amidase domain
MNSRATELECIFSSNPDNQGPLDCLIISPTIEISQQNQEIDKALVWAKRQYSSGVLLCAVCGGVFMLARLRLLDGRAATTHWSHSQTFANTFPKILVNTDELIIDLGDVITAGGTMAWLDLGLRLVDRYLGPVAMVKAVQYYLADPAGRQQRFYANFSPSLHHGDDAVLRVQLWLQSSPPQSTTIDRMAVEAKLGQRTFLRRFQKATGHAHRIRAALEGARGPRVFGIHNAFHKRDLVESGISGRRIFSEDLPKGRWLESCGLPASLQSARSRLNSPSPAG